MSLLNAVISTSLFKRNHSPQVGWRPAQTASLQTGGDPGDPGGDITSIPRPKICHRWAGTTSCKESTFICIDSLNECAPGY